MKQNPAKWCRFFVIVLLSIVLMTCGEEIGSEVYVGELSDDIEEENVSDEDICLFVKPAPYSELLGDNQSIIEDESLQMSPILSDISPYDVSSPPEDEEVASRRAYVVEMIQHAWGSYSTHCMGSDEIRPTSGECHNWLGMGLTVVDSLSTLYMTGLHDEFNEARDWVKESLDFDEYDTFVSFFETVIRVLGGLLSAYDLSGDELFLNKAADVGTRLAKAYNSENGLPHTLVNLNDGDSGNGEWQEGQHVLADVGSVQLEFTTLGLLTSNLTHRYNAQFTIDALTKIAADSPLLPSRLTETIPVQGGNDEFTVGAAADSYYEYLLKMWIMTGKTNDVYREQYVAAVGAMAVRLYKEHPDHGGYLQTVRDDEADQSQHHLGCFAGGMMALGVMSGAVEDEEVRDEHMNMARQLTKTCALAYVNNAVTGIAPEAILFDDDHAPSDATQTAYNLRPETVESIFLLWRATGDQVYRDWGWKIAQSINTHCRTDKGFTSIPDVFDAQLKGDLQDSFFLAETLKYLYLLFSDDDALDLDAYVFNTEAHPLRVRSVNTTIPHNYVPEG